MKRGQSELNLGEIFFKIKVNPSRVTFQNANEKELYGQHGEGFIRKGMYDQVKMYERGQQFVDTEFQLNPSSKYRMVRLFELYNHQERDLFPNNFKGESSYFHPQSKYPSFLAQSGIVASTSPDYLRTLFIEQQINRDGYYRYFVKRNGQYYVEETDDLIPVDKKTWKPLWGLSLEHPWQIMLMKFWLKECRSFDAFTEAEPFRFIEAFGLYSYKLFNFRKELGFIENEKTSVTNLQKQKKRQGFALFQQDTVIIGQTINQDKVEKVGLVSNSAAYALRRISPQNSESILFQVYSNLPCSWVGNHTAVQKTGLNDIYKNLNLNLENKFIMNEKEVRTFFNKLYVVRKQSCKPSNLKLQDCIQFKQSQKPVYLKFKVNSKQGILGISIELPKKNNLSSKKSPEFRYFLSRKFDENEMSRSAFREDILAASRMEENLQITSSCNKWQYYRIDYVQGYTNHSASFTNVIAGEYVLYIDIEENTPFNVRFDSDVSLERPRVEQPSPTQEKQIFDSTFFSISSELGVITSFNQQTKNETITLDNSFQELGYGSVVIKTLPSSQYQVAMRVNPAILRANGLQLLSHYDKIKKGDKDTNFVLVSQRGKSEIVVLERIKDKSKSQINEEFPPSGSIEFFKVTPNSLLKPNGSTKRL